MTLFFGLRRQTALVTPFDQSVRDYVGDYYLNYSKFFFTKKKSDLSVGVHLLIFTKFSLICHKC
jgi:hypothetical protein